MADTTPCSQCGTVVPTDVEFCPNCNFYMNWAKDPDDEESAARSPRLPDEEVTPEPAPPPEPVVETGDPCPKCGVGNDPARVFCRRCGHDLRTPIVEPVPVAPAPSPPPWLIPVLVVAGVLLLVVVWAAFLRDGGNSTAVDTTAGSDDVSVNTTAELTTTQPATTEAPIIDVLGAGQITVTASSSLPGSYGPENLIDGVLETAWNHCGTSCEATGEARQGVGESLRFDFEGEVVLAGFRIANGYQKESETLGDIWIKNNRIRQVSLTTTAGTETAEIGDDRGYQTIDIEPVTTDFLILEVTQVYEGDGTYNDLGVSEIEVLVQIN